VVVTQSARLFMAEIRGGTKDRRSAAALDSPTSTPAQDFLEHNVAASSRQFFPGGGEGSLGGNLAGWGDARATSLTDRVASKLHCGIDRMRRLRQQRLSAFRQHRHLVDL
jgi:hypothetical protein